jgi:hypothetical protein
MSRQDSSCKLWPATKASWHHNWGVWLAGELQYSKDLKELLDVVDI